MKVCVLTANLNNFDTPVDPVKQSVGHGFHRFTDENFPPIKGLTPRFQYRIPKLFGWQFKTGYDYYIWLDGSVSLTHKDSIQWLLDKCYGYDFAVFNHPSRKTIKEEVDHLESYLTRKAGTKKGQDYLIDRYENGLHKEQLEDITNDKDYTDDRLFASTTFVYKDSEHVRDVLRLWWLHQSRYYTCDQVVLPYILKDSAVNIIKEDPFNNKYTKRVSEHK